VNNFTKKLSAALLFTFLLGLTTNIWAQRNVSYRDLVMRNQERPVSFDFIVLPGETPSEVQFTSVFSFSYSYLPFKKTGNRNTDQQFYSTANLSMEVFKGGKNFNKRKRNDNISVEGLEPVGRAFWGDTAYAQTYEQSQSKKDHLHGYLDLSLAPGNYNYVMQLKRGEETESRMSRTQSVRIRPYEDMPVGNIILREQFHEDNGTTRLQLTTMGSNVEYATDFHLMAYLPRYEADTDYSLTISRLNVVDEDTSRQSQVYNTSLSGDDIRTNIHPRISSTDKETFIDLDPSSGGYAYALLQIPNSNFPNALYRVTVRKEGQDTPVAQGTYRSLWVDMPTSLLNLDVAIDMLSYVADDKTIDRLSSGSQIEREEKFREYWDKRDPTPDTEFNELMAEYYRRIDYAYRNYTTNNVLGYNSDQGEVYIKFGPPQNIERKFPTDGATTEIWTYQNRRFVFKATTGFGDFQLVNNQSE
jgi:GWxTD domain-containing protein